MTGDSLEPKTLNSHTIEYTCFCLKFCYDSSRNRVLKSLGGTVIIEIYVVSYENQLWFELGGVKFDTLHAIWELDRKELRVIRSYKTVARARVSEARGEPIFHDYGIGDIRLHGSSLHVEDFELDDRLILEIPDGFDLVDDLRKSCWIHKSLIATMPVGKMMTIDEMRGQMNPELDRTREIVLSNQILRFRRDK